MQYIVKYINKFVNDNKIESELELVRAKRSEARAFVRANKETK